jgi:hypothetical protein
MEYYFYAKPAFVQEPICFPGASDTPELHPQPQDFDMPRFFRLAAFRSERSKGHPPRAQSRSLPSWWEAKKHRILIYGTEIKKRRNCLKIKDITFSGLR